MSGLNTARKTIVGTNACFGGPATTATIDSSNNPSAAFVNNLNVQFGSKATGEQTPGVVHYQGDPDITIVQPTPRDTQFPAEETLLKDDREILVFLVQTFHDIITKDIKSLLNIIDQSGLVILDAKSLIGLIAKVMDVPENCVKIEIEEEVDLGCCAVPAKISPLKPIRRIKIKKDSENFTDFSLTYNGQYNRIQDEYCISLEKVYECS